MSLDFGFTDCAPGPDGEKVYDEPGSSGKKWHPVANALVWKSMDCGYNKITEGNYKEVARRLGMLQVVLGPLVKFGDGPAYVTEADVKLYIGMWTNATPKTKEEFGRDLLEHLENEGTSTVVYADKTAYQIVADHKIPKG